MMLYFCMLAGFLNNAAINHEETKIDIFCKNVISAFLCLSIFLYYYYQLVHSPNKHFCECDSLSVNLFS